MALYFFNLYLKNNIIEKSEGNTSTELDELSQSEQSTSVWNLYSF